MCIQAIGSFCSWLCCSDEEEKPQSNKFNSETKFSKSTLTSIAEEDFVRQQVTIEIQDTLDCLIEWEEGKK